MPVFFIDKMFAKTRHRFRKTSTKMHIPTLTNCEEKVGNRGTAQKTTHRAVVLQQHHKIIKLCENYNFLAAEAKYHCTCYIEFTRPRNHCHQIQKTWLWMKRSTLMRRTMDLKSYLSLFVLKLLQKLSWLRWRN